MVRVAKNKEVRRAAQNACDHRIEDFSCGCVAILVFLLLLWLARTVVVVCVTQVL